MAERSVFEKLANTLPEKERRELLDKITRSMSFGDNIDESIYEKQMTSDEREELIRQDLDRLSLFGRFIIWLKGAISGKSRRDLMVSARIKALKAAINRRYSGLTGFETRDITPKFAQLVFELYKLALPLIPIYRQLLIRSREMEGAFIRLVERRYPETRVGLEDVVSIAELEAVYEEKGQEQAVRQTVLAKIEEFGSTLDDAIFEEIEEEIIPIFFLKDIVFFPYASFFDLFHVSLPTVLSEEEPMFRGASAMLTIEHLEKLHLALYNASKIPRQTSLHRSIATYLAGLEPRDTSSLSGRSEGGFAQSRHDERRANDTLRAGESAVETIDEPEDDLLASESEMLITEFSALLEGVHAFEKRVPIVELIRYFLRDPYHRMYVYPSQVRLRDYYLGVLEVRILSELEEREPKLRESVVEHKIERVFKGRRLAELRHYRQYTSIDYEKFGLPFFSRTRSLGVLYNFIRWYYHEYLQELVKILSTVILVQNRVIRNRLLQHATTIEDLEEKILDFDATLSPETEEGKNFHRLRASLAGDTIHQRMFRTVVLQKDAQVNTLVERGREGLAGLQRTFEEVYLAPSEAVRERLSSRFYLNGRFQSLSHLLKERAEYIRAFLGVLLQVMRLEGV